ncbi:MAG: hypothetical protein ACI9HK_002030 [Pirellulaceae bacterium]|jgi:hypothetical protein
MDNNALPNSDDVEHLMLNAQLRNELEPFLDESVDRVDVRNMPTEKENEFLMSMLEWERAPVLPISQWFDPEMVLTHPELLQANELHNALWDTIHRLYDKHIFLEYTDHLSDRELYCLIFRDILPSSEKMLNLPRTSFRHWHCLDHTRDTTTWLRYYASNEERRQWQCEADIELPPCELPPYPRKMPRRPK